MLEACKYGVCSSTALLKGQLPASNSSCVHLAEDHWDLDKHLKFADMSNLPFDLALTEVETVKDAVLWNR